MKNMDKFYLVGGAIRDELMGVVPHDHDYVVMVDSFDAMRDEILRVGGTIHVEKPEHLTIRGKIPNIGDADFVLPRCDGVYSDGRRPDSTRIAKDIYTDSLRRDFTIGAMYKNVSTGELIDYHGGKRDIELELINCVGDAYDRFTEDSLRMIRAMRFAITKRFYLSEDIVDCLQNPHMLKLLKNVSTNRIREEVFKCFRDDPCLAINRFSDYPLLMKEMFRDGLWLETTLKKRTHHG